MTVGKFFGKVFGRLTNGRWGKIADDNRFGIQSCTLCRPCGVIFTVGTGEYGNKNLWFCNLNFRRKFFAALITYGLNRFALGFNIAGEYRLQFILVNTGKFIKVKGTVFVRNIFFFGGCTYKFITFGISLKFQNETAVIVAENILQRKVGKLKSYGITYCHFKHGFGNTAHTGSITGKAVAAFHKSVNLIKHL